ncbi:MAG: NAD(P)-dependent oxidoreductase [Candidatus Paceibacterota bacterium]
MTKIVVTQDLGLNIEEKERLNKLGEVKYYDDLPKIPEDWLERCKGADVICSGKFGLKLKYQELENTFLSLPFVATDFLNRDVLNKRNIKVSNCPGCNKEAVSEWIIAMILNLLRDLPNWINKKESDNIPKETKGLVDKNITILGKGNVGFRVGKICEALEMNVKYFTKNDNLIESVKEADVVVDTLGSNETTKGLLNKEFFNSLKKGSYFLTVTSPKIYDAEVMIEALDKNILAGIASDCASIQVGDVNDSSYIKLANHPKVLATPHIAYNTDATDRKASKMMIDNIEAYLKGNPINLIN